MSSRRAGAASRSRRTSSPRARPATCARGTAYRTRSRCSCTRSRGRRRRCCSSAWRRRRSRIAGSRTWRACRPRSPRAAAMASLIYSAITSLDGYVADENGNFDWAAPDEDVHRFVNDLERPVGTYLYGRRMYDVMVYWETADTGPDQPPYIQDYAEIWQQANKIVYSKTLETVSSARTTLERDFDPGAVRQLKPEAPRDISVGGPELAGEAIKAGLVDEYQLFVSPVLVGGGTPALPQGVRLDLELLDERRFGNGTVYLRYRTTA